MPNLVARPGHLPDFKKPPLSEVALGVQFAVPQGYQQIRAGEVWHLFEESYPIVQEHPALSPNFETFGLPAPFAPMPQFSFASAAPNTRYWFLRTDGAELIQFQQDRLLHNWRKIGDGKNTYPRFEAMLSELNDKLLKLQSYFSSLNSQKLAINQCEITYVNKIITDSASDNKISDWLSFLKFENKKPDDLSITLREVIRSKEGEPRGRFYAEVNSVLLPDGKTTISLTLTVKGAPLDQTIESGLDFLSAGRDIIVCKFAELTSDKAHKKWERVK